ncbi:MAG TPA: MerR family transcriptional regulator [Nannocystaceae bacterium]|nr:MerR family transcriptional regulator [Nannocystaceae bacterium]
MAQRSKARKSGGSDRSSADGGSASVDLGSDKLYFKIGEVAEIVGVPAYVLRYWESEFKAIRPQKSRTQQRVYRRRDVVTLLRIKHLLYEQRFTIAGARVQLKESGEDAPVAKPSSGYLARQSLCSALAMLDELRAFVRADEPLERNAADPSRFLERARDDASGGPASRRGRSVEA